MDAYLFVVLWVGRITIGRPFLYVGQSFDAIDESF